MQHSSWWIKVHSLKHLLELFHDDDPIRDLRLGDTWHPRKGYVDERDAGPFLDVRSLRHDPYGFGVLVSFSARIGSFHVALVASAEGDGDWFCVRAPSWELRDLESRVALANTQQHNSFVIKKAWIDL